MSEPQPEDSSRSQDVMSMAGQQQRWSTQLSDSLDLFQDAGVGPAQLEHNFDESHYPQADHSLAGGHWHHINSALASDATSDAQSRLESLAETRSMGQSQTPGGSTTGRRQRHSADNPRGKKPTSLSYYRSTEVHAPLTEAKESFAATAFSSGFFFYHQNSHHRETFKTYARDAIGQAANAHNIKVDIDKNIMTLVYNTLGSRRSTLKKEARLIVEKQYALINTDGKNNCQWAEHIALKIRSLLDDAGPSNMAFTDGPNDVNGYLGRWNHPCCQEIISKFLFENSNSLGHKFTARFGPPLTTELVAFGHTMAYICLEEWVTGARVSRDLNVVDSERKYNSILAGMRAAENDEYAGPLLRTMYRKWWDCLIETNSLEASQSLKPNIVFRKTYGPPLPQPPSHTLSWDMLSEESESLQKMASTSSSSLLLSPTYPGPGQPGQQVSFPPISLLDTDAHQAAASESSSWVASSTLSNELYSGYDYMERYVNWPTVTSTTTTCFDSESAGGPSQGI